jgi:hypothetical protein
LEYIVVDLEADCGTNKALGAHVVRALCSNPQG